jgi:predicted PurR-regulated permease PerM
VSDAHDADRATKPAPAPPLRVEITAGTMLRVALFAFGAWLVVHLTPVVLVLVVALFVVGTLSPAVEWLEKRKVGRGKGIALVFTSVLVAAVLIGALTLPSLFNQVAALIDQEPTLRARLADTLAHSKVTAPLGESLRTAHYEGLAKEAGRVAIHYSTQAFEIIAYGVSAVFLGLYIMIDRDRVRGGLFAVVPRSHHIRLSRILLNLEVIVGGYIRGQVITSALMATFTFVLLTACGVSNAIALAVFAGVADVLPYIGVFLSVGPAVAAAASRGPVVVVVVLGVMLAYEEFESRVLVPRIYGRALRLPSSVVMLALIAGGTLMGILGALLALPVAAAVRMLVEELRVDLPGEDIDDGALREKDERAEEEYERRAEGEPAQRAAAIAVEIADERRKEEGDAESAAEVPVTEGTHER